MQKYIVVTGKTEDDALTKGLQPLGLARDDVSVAPFPPRLRSRMKPLTSLKEKK